MASRTTSSTGSPAADTAAGTKAVTKSGSRTGTRKSAGEASTTPKATTKTPSTRKKSATLVAGGNAVQLSSEERQRYVSEAAYFIAERRGFAPGSDVEDWLQAEFEIDRLLAGTTKH